MSLKSRFTFHVSRLTFHASRLTSHIPRPTFQRPICFTNLTLLNPDGPAGHTVRVRGGRVVAIDEGPQKTDLVIDGRGGLLIPGLINAHDHLELNNFRRLKYRALYSHSLQWIEDIEARFETDPDLVGPRQPPLADRLLIGLVKNLLSGVTMVCHHNPLHRPLRRNNIIRVVKRYGFCHSLFRGEESRRSYRRTPAAWPWLIHLAEGTDGAAAAEFDRLDQIGLVQANTVLVHGVGLTARQRQALIERGGGLVWCPGSNDFMLRQTARVAELSRAGRLALGSDSRLSGEFDLLQELRVASATEQLSPQALFKTVTVDAARLLRLQQKGVGAITPGGPADLVLLPAPATTDPFEQIARLDRNQLRLVMVAGRPLVGSPDLQPLFEATHTKFTPVTVDGSEKLLVENLGERLKKASAVEPGVRFL